MHTNQRGQSLIEFATFLLLILSGFAIAGPLIKSQWDLVRCNISAFKQAERALKDEKSLGAPSPHTSVTITPTEVTVEAQCGTYKTKVVLKKLEALDS